MKSLNISIILLILTVISCSTKSDASGDFVRIGLIENKLLPTVIIEGAEPVEFNIHERMKHYSVPGVSIAFMDQGKIAWAKGYGFTSFDSIKEVDEFTLFQAASISKPVAAMAALSMVEEGKIDLDQNVNQYLKDWQVEDNDFTRDEKVTLRRILSHSAGLTVHGFAGYAYDEEVPGVIQILDGKDPANSDRIVPFAVPGSRYSYSGGGYTLMQKMLCDLSGKEFPEIMDQYVLSKIGMNSSTYEQPLPAEFQENAASAHRGNGTVLEGKWHTYPEMAAAGLWTTPSDLLTYAAEVQKSYAGESNLILSQSMVEEMLTPQTNSHGLGPGLRGSGDSIAFGHGGSNAGFQCQLLAFTKLGQGVAIMTNGDRGRDLLTEILRSFSSVYGWNMYKPETKTIASIGTKNLELLSGKYVINRNGGELIVEFSVEDDHLQCMQVWDNFSYEIYPESDTSFFNLNDGADFQFAKDQNGSINEVIVHVGGQEYRFARINQ